MRMIGKWRKIEDPSGHAGSYYIGEVEKAIAYPTTFPRLSLLIPPPLQLFQPSPPCTYFHHHKATLAIALTLLIMGKSQVKKKTRGIRHNPIRVPDSHLGGGKGNGKADPAKEREMLPVLNKVGLNPAFLYLLETSWT